jgi:copper transport protein
MCARLRASGLAVSIVALVALTGTLAYAAVHIRLESSMPAADEVLSAPPERFELRFSGPVNDALSVVVLTYPSGDSVSLDVSSPETDSRILVADTPPLEQGEHLVRWRTVSADGHPVDGEFRFTLAGAPQSDGRLPDDSAVASARIETDPGTSVGSTTQTPALGAALIAGLGLACLLGFAGLLWFCGALPLLREPRIRTFCLALGWAALGFLAVDLIEWVRQVAPSGMGLAGVQAALGSRTGVVAILQLVLIAGALFTFRQSGRGAAVIALVALLVGAASGHTAAISPWLTIPANAVHQGAVAIWLGGLLLLVLAPDAPTDGSDGWRFPVVARSVSAAALFAVVLIAASGIVQSFQFVGDLGAYTSTPYGRGLLVKWAGFLILVGFGAYHRSRVMPHLEEDGDGRALRRMVRFETIVMLAVIMVAAWLARVSPPAGH